MVKISVKIGALPPPPDVTRDKIDIYIYIYIYLLTLLRAPGGSPK